MSQQGIAKNFFFIIFIALMILMAMMVKPLLNSFLFGAILAGSFYPIFSMLKDVKGFNRNRAAIIVTLAIKVIVFIPSFFILKALSK